MTRVVDQLFTRGRAASLLGLCYAALVSGCMNNPMWRSDKYDVRGVFEGTTCRLWINEKPIPMDTVPPSRDMDVAIDYAYGVDLPAGQGLKSMSCNNVLFVVNGPIGALPSPGEYRVTTDDNFLPRSVGAIVSSSGITAGAWPFATGVYVQGYEGVVRLDSMDRKRVWAKFQFLGRRQHSGTS